MTLGWREWGSIAWLVAKIVVVLLCMDPGITAFVYQNF